MSHKCMAGSTLLSNLVSVVPIQVLCDSHWFSKKTMIDLW